MGGSQSNLKETNNTVEDHDKEKACKTNDNNNALTKFPLEQPVISAPPPTEWEGGHITFFSADPVGIGVCSGVASCLDSYLVNR